LSTVDRLAHEVFEILEKFSRKIDGNKDFSLFERCILTSNKSKHCVKISLIGKELLYPSDRVVLYVRYEW
jgi:hypothetical protein